ncbi:PEP-CTERM sorting domain-containing protein [Botrimarina sp.]|uniref:PEP-CTERM sorting domain-containing protein n=1 Tax=Botrimarina sp. TaxID=2795802 RepID=UPI0032EE20FB
MLKPIHPTKSLTACLCLAAAGVLTAPAQAAISWDGEAGTNWWFDPQNWSQDAFNLLPPSQDNGGGTVRATDAQINDGTGPWDTTGEGVVYDPVNDPNYAAASSLQYPTGSSATAFVGRDYGPEHLYRLYVSRNTTAQNLITIKSGDLVLENTTIIGRSGSTAQNQNEGRINQLGGRVRLPLTNLDIGLSESSGWGNGVYGYYGGTLEAALEGGTGIRLGHGRGGTGPSGVNRFIVGNGEAGHIRVWDYSSISYRGSEDGVFTEGQDPNGVDRGVAITEFRLENGGTRPVQVGRNLTLNNGVEASTGGILSSRLVLSLEEAPMVDGGGVPLDLGLFDVNFDIGFGDNGGVINGFGDIDNDGVNDQIFASADGSTYYMEGDTVSAMFGGTRYDWSISYTGDISWTDADNSVVGTILGPGSGNDVVLIGLGSESVGLAGDYNNDGLVDAADYTVWRDGDSPDSSQAGYDLWASNYGAGGASAAATPEPSAAALLLSVGGAWLFRRR